MNELELLSKVDPWWLVALLAAVIVLGWVRSRVGRWLDGRRRKRRLQRAADGEERARRLLESEGYAVLDSQVAGQLDLRVDQESHRVDLRADHLVERRGRRFVAEVKTGQTAPDPTHTATRRQLLEYRLAFRADGILLVDMEAVRVYRVRFPDID